MEEKIKLLFEDVKEHFGDDSNKMFTIIILMIFMNGECKFPDYLRIPELKEYIDYMENSPILQEIFKKNSNN